MLDIHTHILPGMDDGSKNAAQSIALLEREAAQGVHAVALTPHYLARKESPEHFLERRRLAEQELQAAIQGRTDLPALFAGAEVAYFEGISRSESIELLCLGNTKALLVEMPFCKWSQRMLRELQELLALRNIQPVIAHVERYLSFQPSGMVQQLCENDMLIQVNASSLFHRLFASQHARLARLMLESELVDIVASDAHDVKSRSPQLLRAYRAVEKQYGAARADRLFYETPQQLLAGE